MEQSLKTPYLGEPRSNPLYGTNHDGVLIGNSPATQKLRQQLATVSGNLAPVLLMGPPGTAKNDVAMLIHQRSQRMPHRFCHIDCAAIPPEDLAGNLFRITAPGHNLFEQCRKGTLYLANMEALVRHTQVQLAERIKSDPQYLPARLIFATETDPRQAIEAGNLQPELYYLLEGGTIQIPPLRERRADIPQMIEQCRRHRAEQAQQTPENFLNFTPEAMGILINYDWPGNIGELRSFLDYIQLQHRQEPIEDTDLPELFRLESGQVTVEPQIVEVHELPPDQFDLRQELAHIEVKILAQALRKFDGNISDTARYLQLKRTTLQQKIKRFGLQ